MSEVWSVVVAVLHAALGSLVIKSLVLALALPVTTALLGFARLLPWRKRGARAP